MKKLLSVILCVSLIFSMAVSSVALASDEINVTINGVKQNYDVMPVIVDGRTLVPMRGIFEALGAKIKWVDATKTVVGTRNTKSVKLRIDDYMAYINGEETILDVPATIINGRTMVPVRFVSEMLGENVGWNAETKTVEITSDYIKNVAIQPGLATLTSTFHRPVPTEFEKSNDLSDLLYFGNNSTPEEQESKYSEVRSMAEVVCSTDEYINGLTPIVGPEYGSLDVVDVEGMPFDKVMRITCTKVPEKSAGFISKTKATPRGGVKKTDKMIFSFRLRTVSGGDENGTGKVQVQVEHPETYKKAIFEYAEAGKDWTVIYLPFEGVDDATSIGIRGGFYEQVVEIGGIEILKFPDNFDLQTLPKTTVISDDYKEDAPWRKEALDRIEKIRKGDFTVIVKDKDGNVIPDAEVEFDMFEHQFQFGNAMKGNIINDQQYRTHAQMLFNSSVLEHNHKWAPYEKNPNTARVMVNSILDNGIQNVRGHSVFWDMLVGSDGKTLLVPEYIVSEELKNPDNINIDSMYDSESAYKMVDEKLVENKELYDAYAKKHAYQIVDDNLGMINEWDVYNETIGLTVMKDIFGPQVYVDAYKWAREAGGEDMKLYLNEYEPGLEGKVKKLQEFVDLGVDFDGFGWQAHLDQGRITEPTKLLENFAAMAEFGKELKVTEFSASMPDQFIQGSVIRDTMICTFAEELMTGFIMWGFYDGANFRSYSPIYDKDWNLKPGGKAYIDLVYNKWWTRDAKATTDANGKATVRGFYGDYDVTVTANGKTYTDMVAFHKGYDNIFEITID